MKNIDQKDIKNSNYIPKYNIQQIYHDQFNASFLRIQGNRKSMEDNYYIDIIENIKIIALFDGHGGDDISNILPKLLKNVNKYILEFKNLKIDLENLSKKISKEFIFIDKILIKKFLNRIGCTAIILYILDNNIISINLGDSKTIFIDHLFKKKFETNIHRPNEIIEYYRIINSNNKVTLNNKIYRINNQLSVSRSFGDFRLKILDGKYNGINSPVSVIPDIYNFFIDENLFIIVATDGFWDYIKYQEIIDIIKKYNSDDTNKISHNLIVKSIENGSNDNISLIFMKINA
tara:strand:+ start:70 stop:939 length:870 start_codon:yes stop_codon:yes gene_type:complete